MALDFTILDFGGRPLKQVGVSFQTFWQIMSAAEELFPAGVLKRMRDYYEDAEFPQADLPEAIVELRRLRESAHCDEGTRIEIGQLIDLMNEARSLGESVTAIAD